MTDLPLTKISETATTVTLGWTPVPGCAGYVLYQDGVRKSNSWDPAKSSWKTNKAAHIRIAAVGVVAEGVYPPPVAPAVFGQDLPPRNLPSPGPVVDVTTLAQIRAALNSGAAGRTVRLTHPLHGNGDLLLINAKGTAEAPITLDLAAPVTRLRIVISGSAHLNLRFTDIGYSPIDGIKLTDGSHHVDIDGSGGTIHHSARQGFLETGQCADWQLWNVRFRDNGDGTTNQDHDLYVSSARGKSVVANVDCRPSAYGIHIYPDSRDLTVTAFTVVGSRSATPRGGVILGTENAGQQTSGIRLVGGVIVVAAHPAVSVHKTVVGCYGYDLLSWNNGGGFTGQGISYTHCVEAAPAANAKGFVARERWGLLPATDIDGRPRVTADAGAYAL